MNPNGLPKGWPILNAQGRIAEAHEPYEEVAYAHSNYGRSRTGCITNAFGFGTTTGTGACRPSDDNRHHGRRSGRDDRQVAIGSKRVGSADAAAWNLFRQS